MDKESIIYDTAIISDIPEHVRLRILYMIEYAREHQIYRIDLVATDE